MEFTHYNLGNLRRGQIVEIKLEGNAANIRMMSQENYGYYVKNSRYVYFGGRATRSPTHLRVPTDGHWHVAIDMHGLKGAVKTGCKVLSNNAKSLTEEYKFDIKTGKSFMPKEDIFVAYASEDSDTIVHQLISALDAKGLRVCPGGFEISEYASLQSVIKKGLADSWIGAVVLSRAMLSYSSKSGNDNIITKNQSGEELIVLIRHDISIRDVGSAYPSLFHRPLLSTSEYSTETLADKIIRTLNNNKFFYI